MASHHPQALLYTSQNGLNPQAIPYFPSSHTPIPPLNHNTFQYYDVASSCPNTHHPHAFFHHLHYHHHHHQNIVLPPQQQQLLLPPLPPPSFVSDIVEAVLDPTLHFHDKQHEKEAHENINDCEGGGRRRRIWECRRGRIFRPPRWVRRLKPHGGAGEEEGGKFNNNNNKGEEEGGKYYYIKTKTNNRRKKGTNHPVVPVRNNGSDTTIMIRNIPNKYSRAMLLEFLDNHCLKENQKVKLEKNPNSEEEDISAYDIVYLPIDFKTRMNKGYGFVNFTNPKGALKFHNAINNQKWDFFRSQKICDVALARLQGKDKLKKHFESLIFECEWEEVLPVCFSPPRDGTVKGVQRTVGKLSLSSNN